MIRVSWDASGMEARLGGISTALRDLTPVWPTVHEIVVRFFRAIFAAQGAYPTGRPWVPLNPAYARWKQRQVGDKPILQFTGDLYASMQGGAEHVFRFGPAFMETGTSDIKARTHQWGYPPRNIPARPIVQKPSRAEGERIVDAILAFLFGAARRVK
jgi:hypothetical protein